MLIIVAGTGDKAERSKKLEALFAEIEKLMTFGRVIRAIIGQFVVRVFFPMAMFAIL